MFQTLLYPVDLLNRIDKALKLFKENDLVSALLEILYVEQNYIYLNDSDVFKFIIKDKLEMPQIDVIRRSGKDIMIILKLLNESNKWNVLKHMESSEIRYFQKQEKLNFKISGHIKCSLLYILIALLEVELYPEWLPSCIKGDIISSCYADNKLVVKLSMEFYLFKREIIFTLCNLKNLNKNGSIFLQIMPSYNHYCDNFISPQAYVEGGIILKAIPKTISYVWFIKNSKLTITL